MRRSDSEPDGKKIFFGYTYESLLIQCGIIDNCAALSPLLGARHARVDLSLAARRRKAARAPDMRSSYALLVCLAAPPLSSAFMVAPSKPLSPAYAVSSPISELRTPHANMAVAPLLKSALPLVPGLGLCAALAAVSERAAAATALSPLLWATIFGMVVRPSILLTAMILRKFFHQFSASSLLQTII